jgi:hypothetical protein
MDENQSKQQIQPKPPIQPNQQKPPMSQVEIDKLVQENTRLKMVNSELHTDRAKLISAVSGEDPKGFVEIVCVPPKPGMLFGPLIKNGKTYEEKVDANKFEHYMVPVSYASILCGERDGRRFVFVGPMNKLQTTRRIRGRVVTDIMPKHFLSVVGGVSKWVEFTSDKG